jgi:protein-tyrosine phosphatase
MILSRDKLISRQRQALSHYGTSLCVDMHCHCLPGVDDGAQDWAESQALCAALISEGINVVVATPHQLGRFDGCVDAPGIRQRVKELNESLARDKWPLVVLPGAEIRVDERVFELLEQDYLMTMADEKQVVLLELPFDMFIDIRPLLAHLASANIRAIIAHPERNRELSIRPQRVMEWAEYNPALQITASSLLGRFGNTVQKAGYALMDLPLLSFVATDAHNTDQRGPCFADAFDWIARFVGLNRARQLFVDNAQGLIQDLAVAESSLSKERMDPV